MIPVKNYRDSLKCYFWKIMNYYGPEDEKISDMQKGIARPAAQKPLPEGTDLIQLPDPQKAGSGAGITLVQAIARRKSRRKFKEQELSLEELSFLLWSTQGLRETDGKPSKFMRTVPSAGARHALDTYIFVHRVKGLGPGLYRYQPVEHGLVYMYNSEDLTGKVAEACMDQEFCAECAATFIWAAVPYRMEWKYGKLCQELILLDAGHVCQNLYLACEAVSCGTCAIAAYDQEKLDQLIRVDGEQEIAIYAAPVGRV